MKYSKIALFLILLTSSASASSPSFFRSDKELETFAENAFKKLSEKGENTIDINTLPGRKLLTETQKNKLNGVNFTNDSEPILKALKKARAEETADFIFGKCGANGVSSIDLSGYDSKLTTEQYEKINTFEKGSGGLPLQKDEIEDFLLNGNLPKLLTQVDKILKVANGDKVSLKEWNAYGCDLNENQYEAIKKYEKYSVRLLNENDLKNFIDNGSLPDLDADEKKKAILDLSNDKVGEVNGISDYATNEQIEVIIKKETESNSRIDEDLLEKILKASNDELEELAKPVTVPASDNSGPSDNGVPSDNSAPPASH